MITKTPDAEGSTVDFFTLDPTIHQGDESGQTAAPVAAPDASGQLPTGDPGAPAEDPAHVEPKNDPTRFEYWQRQTALRDNVLNVVKPYLPIIEKLQANPKLLDQLTAPPAPAAPKGPVRPEAPVQPEGFNEAEAFGDPASPSGKYLAAERKYQTEMVKYLEAKDTEREARLVAQQRQQEEVTQRTQRQREVAAILQKQYKFSADDVADFLKMVEEDPSLDDLVTVHQSRKARAAGPKDDKAQEAALLERMRRQQVPMPVGVGAGQGMTAADDNALLDGAMMEWKKK